MLKNASAVALLIAGLLSPAATRPAAQGPGRSRDSGKDRSPDARSLSRHGDGVGAAALARRQPDHLHARLDRQSERQARVGAVDHEHRRQPQSLPREGIRRALVTIGRPHRVHHPGRAEGHADLRALDGRRRRDLSGHPGRAGAVGRRLVARRQAALVFDARRRTKRLADQDAQGTDRGQVDRSAAHRRTAELPARSHRLHRQRLPPRLRRARLRRHAAADHVRQLRSHRH